MNKKPAVPSKGYRYLKNGETILGEHRCLDNGVWIERCLTDACDRDEIGKPYNDTYHIPTICKIEKIIKPQHKMKLNIPKFQLDLSKIPVELNEFVREQIKAIVEKNGYTQNVDLIAVQKFLIFGQNNEPRITFSTLAWFNDYDGFTKKNFYDVLKDWDVWTKFKVEKAEFKPITIKLPNSTGVVSKNKVCINWSNIEAITGVTLTFNSIHKLHEAVLVAEAFNRENS